MKSREGRGIVVVLVTCPNRSVACRIAKQLIRQRLCACINILSGVESIFQWKGEVESASETLLLIKTTSVRFEALKCAVVKIHPYDLPEIIALPISAGHVPYLRWVASSTL